MLQIEFKGMEHKAPYKRIFCPNTQPQLPRLGQKVKLFACQRRDINSTNLTSVLPGNTSGSQNSSTHIKDCFYSQENSIITDVSLLRKIKHLMSCAIL